MRPDFEHHPGSPPVGLQEALSEKTFTAERVIAGIRLVVIGANTLIYTLFTDKSGTVPRLAYAVILLSWIYGLYVYIREPYRRHPVFLSAYFTTITDAAFIMLWLFATGGFYSSFYVLLYPAMVSVAFRFTAKETTFAALVYSGAYFALLLGLGQIAGHGQEALVRITYTFLMAALGHLISREVLAQTKSKITYKEHIKAVEAAEVKFRALAETANDAIISADSSGAIMYSNPSARRMFGYSAQEMVGKSLSELVGKTGAVGKTIEVRGKRKDGDEFPAELSLAGWRAGEAQYHAAIIRDVVERKKAQQTALDLVREQTLRASAEEAEQRSAFLAEASRVLGASLEHEAGLRNLVRLVVPTFSDSCSIDLIEEKGEVRRVARAASVCGARALLDEEPDLRPVGNDLAAVLETGRVLLLPDAGGKASQTATGDPGGSSSLTVPVSGHAIYGAITFAMDRSSRHFKPSDVAVGEELGRRVAVAVEHSRLFTNAQEAIRARDDFLSVASHELNTPLTALQLHMDILQQHAREESSKVLNRIEHVRRQVLRLTKLIRNLLDVSRITSGKLALEYEDVDLSEVVRDAVERSEEAGRRAGSAIEVSAHVPVIGRWDRMRIDQVVSNLLTNAIKYGEAKPIDISVESFGDVARLSVRDRGMGIPPEEQSKIFERFSRTLSAQRYGGFGLGLWIVHQIVSALGGTIEVSSRPGEGATFVVELPLSQAPHPRKAESGAKMASAPVP